MIFVYLCGHGHGYDMEVISSRDEGKICCMLAWLAGEGWLAFAGLAFAALGVCIGG